MDSTSVEVASFEVASVEVAPGVRLRVRRRPASPAGSSVPFVLVHGLSSNARLWDGVADQLATAGHEVAAVDLRSHGESDAPPDGYDTATAAADVAKVIDALGLSPAVVAGQSWGGNVVVRLAARHPELVAGLALVDGGWLDLRGQFESWADCERALRPPEIDGLSAEKVRGILRSSHPTWSVEALEATLANLRVEPDGTVTRRLPIPEHMRIVRSMWEDPPWPDLAQIAAPVLLMPAIPTAASAATARRATIERAVHSLAQARVNEYVGGDHDLHAEQPEAVAKDLLTLTEAI